ncbi:MAG: hypothetical protein ACPG49_07745 [Chitinophagales bacterium]
MNLPNDSYSHIVLAINDGVKRNRLFHTEGFTVVHSHQELRDLDWSDKTCLLIQTELNWLQNNKRQNTLYDGYFVLLEICENLIPFNGTVAMISCDTENKIYNASNNRLFPLMNRLPFEFVHICDERGDWDKKLLMRHYHTPYLKLSEECKNGLIQLNTGAPAKAFRVEHRRGTSVVVARKNKLGEYIIRKTGVAGWFGKIGQSNTEHGIVDELVRYFFPVRRLSSQILVQES